jgi:hypothetical protein
VYIFDLDMELFTINGCCQFDLQAVDDLSPTSLLEARKRHLQRSVRPCFNGKPRRRSQTDDLNPIATGINATTPYNKLNPTIISPTKSSPLSEKPVFVVCEHLFAAFTKSYDIEISQARDALHETDFLFREAAYLLLCLASLSPSKIRLFSLENIELPSQTSRQTMDSLHHSIIQDGTCSEFVSRPFLGYHLSDQNPGMAPCGTWYWFQDVLVYLCQNVHCKDRFEDAVCSTVAKGRAEGRERFNAVVFSIAYVVLIRVVGDSVHHTKCLSHMDPTARHDPNWENASNVSNRYGLERLEHWLRWQATSEEENEDHRNGRVMSEDLPTKEDDAMNDEIPDVGSGQSIQEQVAASTWREKFVSQEGNAFAALAHLFEAVQKERQVFTNPLPFPTNSYIRLRPSSSSRHGIFPNEIYANIIGYVDRKTRYSCLDVSRSFREYASEVYDMDDNVQVIGRPKREPELYHPAVGYLGPFKSAISRSTNASDHVLQLVPIIGRNDGSAYFVPGILYSFPQLPCSSST